MSERLSTSEKCIASGLWALLTSLIEVVEGLDSGSHGFTFPASIVFLVTGIVFLVFAIIKRERPADQSEETKP